MHGGDSPRPTSNWQNLSRGAYLAREEQAVPRLDLNDSR